ncbi:MAG: hypothetical protein ABEH64_05830 [Salinirussus sp.]
MDRETVYQIVVAVGTVLLFLAAAIAVSTIFAADGGLSTVGGIALIGAILGFIVVLGAAGLWLERLEFEEEESG